jgi:hypothetical protein
MTTQTFRVVRMLTGHSPVARIDGVDEDGHELRLEVPADAARSASVDQILVVNWSLQAQPVAPGSTTEVRSSERTRAGSAPVVDAEFSTPSPDAIDREFMALMAGRRPARAAPAIPVRDIDLELSTLLGAAGAKGQK